MTCGSRLTQASKQMMHLVVGSERVYYSRGQSLVPDSATYVSASITNDNNVFENIILRFERINN